MQALSLFVAVRCLRPSMAFLHHVTDQLHFCNPFVTHQQTWMSHILKNIISVIYPLMYCRFGKTLLSSFPLPFVILRSSDVNLLGEEEDIDVG